MSASINILPVWKKDSSAAEWLQEIAAIALAHPERFTRMIIVYEEELDNRTKVRQNSWGGKVNELLGILQYAISALIEDSRR